MELRGLLLSLKLFSERTRRVVSSGCARSDSVNYCCPLILCLCRSCGDEKMRSCDFCHSQRYLHIFDSPWPLITDTACVLLSTAAPWNHRDNGSHSIFLMQVLRLGSLLVTLSMFPLLSFPAE
eukprot:RCo041849